MYVIGIDHGYGNMKTANCCFPTGVMKSDTEPTFVGDLLIWNKKYYSIGVGHKEFTADKFNDEDYYVLTLAAIARELRRERITEANVFIAAGLPLTWVSEQKAEFKKYLLQHSKVAFTFRGTEYRIITIIADGWKRPVRLDSLGTNYTIDAIERRLAYNRHSENRYFAIYRAKKSPLLKLEQELEFSINHSHDTATVLIDTVFYIQMLILRTCWTSVMLKRWFLFPPLFWKKAITTVSGRTAERP